MAAMRQCKLKFQTVEFRYRHESDYANSQNLIKRKRIELWKAIKMAAFEIEKEEFGYIVM
jgi:(p)ppGpp synthase/HD superfamily hydrolase